MTEVCSPKIYASTSSVTTGLAVSFITKKYNAHKPTANPPIKKDFSFKTSTMRDGWLIKSG